MINKNNKPKIGIIILNWNGFDDTCECVDSIMKSYDDNYEIIIVDNNSSNNEGVLLKNKYSGNNKVIVLINEINSGYCGGNNFAFKYAQERNFDYAIILNNDTIIDPNLISELVKDVEADGKAAVGATILDYKEKDVIQNQGLMFDIWTGISKAVNLNRRYLRNVKIKANFFSGACFIVNCHLIGGSLFDENFFCYFEEIDLCLRLRKAGYAVGVSNRAVVWHKGYASAKKISGFSEKQLARNRFLVVSKNGNFLHKIVFLITNLFIYIPVRMLIFEKNKSGNKEYFVSGIKEGLNFFLKPKRVDIVFIRANSFDSEPRLIKVYNSLKNNYTCKLCLWKLTRSAKLQEDALYFNMYLPYGSRWLKPGYILWSINVLLNLNKYKPRCIHACDMESVMIAYVYQFFFRRVKVVYDIYDVTADKYNFGFNSFKRNILIKIERKLAINSDCLLVPDEARLDELKIERNLLKQCLIIYNSQVFINHAEHKKVIINNCLQISYVGALTKNIRGLEFLIKLACDFSNITVVIAGYGVDETFFKQKIKELNCPNLFFEGRVSFEKAQILNMNSDFIVSLLDPNFNNYRYASSTKIFDAFAIMKPVITTKKTASANIVEETNWGIAVDYDYESLKEAVSGILDGRIRFMLDSSKIQKYNWLFCERKLNNLYQTLIENNGYEKI